MLVRTRVSLLSMLVVTVALGGFGWTVFQATRAGVLAEIQQDVKGRARAIAASIEVDADGTPRAPTLDVFSTPDTYAEVTTTGGEVLQRSSNLPDRGLPFLPEAFDAGRISEARVGDVPMVVYGSAIHDGGTPLGYVVVARSPGPLYQVLHRLRRVLSGGAAVALLVTGLAIWLTVRAALGPLVRLAAAAASIARSQDHSGRVGNTGRRDEIGQLATTIDAMLQALENSHRDIQHANQTQRRFLADVSHELRTPLTIMLSSLELVDKVGETDPDFRQGALDDMRAEVQRMARMVTQLLIMARTGTNATAANRPLLIGEVVADVCRRWDHTNGKATLECSGFEELSEAVVNGNEDYLRQLLMILLDNAFKFTPDSGTVHVRGAVDGGEVRISVVDTGSGIAAGDLPHVFDRFHRTRDSNDRHGVGLGLSIARHIAEQHGGEIEVESELGHGSRFTVNLPLMT
jgi:signal transduction histidine kinase